MEKLHTSGVWEAKQITSTQIIIGIKGYGEGDNYRKDNKCGQIAGIKGWDGNSTAALTDEDKANAKLIAASPKMIEFIGKVMSKLQEHQKEDKKILAGYTLAANIDGFTDLLNEAGEIWRSSLTWSE